MKFKIGKFNFAFWTDDERIDRSKGGRPRVHITYEEVRSLHDSGNSVREIAEKLGVSKSTISNVLRNPAKYK